MSAIKRLLSIQCDSPAETNFWRAWVLLAYVDNIDPLRMQRQVQIGSYRVDFAVPSERLAIEVDGLAYHNGQESFVADRKRQRAIEAEGWRVIRFAALEVIDVDRAISCAREVINAMEKK